MTGRRVLVLGAGVSGYAAAISLASAGCSVTVIDRTLPGPNRLGESLDWETPRFLRQLDLSMDDLLGADEATVKRGAVATHAELPGRLGIGFHPIYRVLMALVGRTKRTYHVDRGALTRTLHRRAEQAGVRMVEAHIDTVLTDGDRISEVRDRGGNSYAADHYVDSTGRARVLAKALGIGVDKIGPQKLAVSARMTHDYDHMGTRIRLDDARTHATWVWDINTGQNATDVGAVFVADDVADARRAGHSIASLFRSELARHGDLDWSLSQIPPEGELHRTAFHDQVSERLVGANWVLAGQAAAVIDPILSSGMSFAFRSGLSAADVVSGRTSNARRGRAEATRHDRLLRSYALTVDTLLDELWYKSRLRFVHGFPINVLLLLVCNFNLNHLQSRWLMRTRLGGAGLIAVHRLARTAIPAAFRLLEVVPPRRPQPHAVPPVHLQEEAA